MIRSYPSDISRNQFAIISPMLVSFRKQTRPRKVDLYDIFCGILYVLKSGCQWRMLPKEYPKWELCYYYFSAWGKTKDLEEDSILTQVLKKISWRGPTKQWSERENVLCYPRFSKRQEYWYCQAKGVWCREENIRYQKTYSSRYARITPCYSYHHSWCTR